MSNSLDILLLDTKLKINKIPLTYYPTRKKSDFSTFDGSVENSRSFTIFQRSELHGNQVLFLNFKLIPVKSAVTAPSLWTPWT